MGSCKRGSDTQALRSFRDVSGWVNVMWVSLKARNMCSVHLQIQCQNEHVHMDWFCFCFLGGM